MCTLDTTEPGTEKTTYTECYFLAIMFARVELGMNEYTSREIFILIIVTANI